MIGAADVANLAGGHEILVRPQGFVDGHDHVRLVTEVEIQVVGLQPPQARVTRSDEIFPREAGLMHAGTHTHERFRDEHEVVPPAFERLTEDFLGRRRMNRRPRYRAS